jgi:hypothetical protein
VAEHPDLFAYHLLHRAMRTDMARVQRTVAALTEVRGADRAHALSRWYAGFLGEFRHHHTVEDEIFFPALAARVDTFAAAEARLDAEHRRLEIVLDAVASTLHDLSTSAEWGEAHRQAVAAAGAATAELDAHLDYEDTDVLPLFVDHMPVADYTELEDRATKRLPRSQIKFSVPWMLSQTSEDERRRLLRDAPVFLRLMWYVTRGRYRRIERRAFE